LTEFVDHEQVAARIEEEVDDVALATTARDELSRLTSGVRRWVREGRSVADFEAVCRSVLGADTSSNGAQVLERASEGPRGKALDEEPADGSG
jgi:hypothetical protein